MHKVKLGALTAGLVKNNFERTVEKFVPSNNSFSFMGLFKGRPRHWNQILYSVLAVVKQLGIPTYFLALSCADLR